MQGSLKKTKEKMADEQCRTQLIVQAVMEATKTGIMAIKELVSTVNNARLVYSAPHPGGPALKQPIFD